MSKGKVHPSIESMAESGEAATPITPQSHMAICAKASLLLSSLRPTTLSRSSDASASLRTEDMVKLKRQPVDLSAEICWLRQQRKKSSHLEYVEVILGLDMVKLRRQLVDLSAEICWLCEQRKKTSHLEYVDS